MCVACKPACCPYAYINSKLIAYDAGSGAEQPVLSQHPPQLNPLSVPVLAPQSNPPENQSQGLLLRDAEPLAQPARGAGAGAGAESESPPHAVGSLEQLQESLNTFLEVKDKVANSMHYLGSMEVTRSDGSHVFVECNICSQEIKEAYKKSKSLRRTGTDSEVKCWPHPSWPTTRQHVKSGAHFAAYIERHGGECESGFADSLEGKSNDEVESMVSEEHRERLGMSLYWLLID